MKKLFEKTLFILCIVFIVSCTDDDDTTFLPDTTTILDFVASDPDYSTLLTALEITDLDVTLNGTSNFTVFAPNNAAFTEFLNGMAIEDVPEETLTQILLNHVLGNVTISTDLEMGYLQNLAEEANTAANFSMYIDTTNGILINGESTVTTADFMVDNGVVHAVDTVISLPTMLTFLTADTNFSTLVNIATTTTGFTTDFTTVLGGNDSAITLLAPDNDAFTALGDVSILPAEGLEQILLNHVVPGFNVSALFTTGYNNTLATYEDTMNNVSIYINTSSGVTFNGSSTVNVADIVAVNGVIHSIDSVIELPTVGTFVMADPTFTSLVSSLTSQTPATDFVSIFNIPNGEDPAPFTIFAPTNDAFIAFDSILEEEALTSVLQYHVVSGANVISTDLTDSQIITTLETGTFTVNTMPEITITDENDRVTNIIVTDVQATNGVIHAIDQVLLPLMN